MELRSETTSSVSELIKTSGDVDNQEIFEKLRSIFSNYKEKIADRFELSLDPISSDFTPYKSAVGPAEGVLKAYSGPEMDWLVDSYMGTPGTGFSNTHLTAWLGPQTTVPHLWMAMGTIPDLFVFFDFGPRVDMSVDLNYFKKYFTCFNDDYVKIQDDQRFGSFISRCPIVRHHTSPTAFSLKMPASLDRITLVEDLGHRMIDQWIDWVDEAEKVPLNNRDALKTRDLLVRRTIAEEDPANDMGDMLYGKELTKKLVKTLWGGNRSLQRPS